MAKNLLLPGEPGCSQRVRYWNTSKLRTRILCAEPLSPSAMVLAGAFHIYRHHFYPMLFNFILQILHTMVILPYFLSWNDFFAIRIQSVPLCKHIEPNVRGIANFYEIDGHLVAKTQSCRGMFSRQLSRADLIFIASGGLKTKPSKWVWKHDMKIAIITPVTSIDIPETKTVLISKK